MNTEFISIKYTTTNRHTEQRPIGILLLFEKQPKNKYLTPIK